jgi:transporter family protein
MATWLIFAASCVGLWGIWGFIAKLTTTRGVHPLALSAISSVTGAIITWVAVLFIQPPWERASHNISFALLTGLCGSLGGIAFFFALGHGRASIVVPLSSLYPAITILLSLFVLGEHPSPKQTLGMILALIASLLLGM